MKGSRRLWLSLATVAATTTAALVGSNSLFQDDWITKTTITLRLNSREQCQQRHRVWLRQLLFAKDHTSVSNSGSSSSGSNEEDPLWSSPSSQVASATTAGGGEGGGNQFDYDFIVIGGGSGGLSAAKRAADLGAKVLLLDYVSPSPTKGTTWGLGGTCVNVGCIPKRIMHYTADLKFAMADAIALGWQNVGKFGHDWSQLRQGVQQYVQRLNESYLAQLRQREVVYVNAKAKLVSGTEVEYTEVPGKAPVRVRGRFILIATGGRPQIPTNVFNAPALAITSDDLFSLPTPPGRTLVVGAGYVALECASFLAGLGYPVSLAVRDQILRGFDRQCVSHVVTQLRDSGLNFLSKGILPQRLDRQWNGAIQATFSDGSKQTYDTVLYATGRAPNTAQLGLESASIQLSSDQHVVVNSQCQAITTAKEVTNIYSLGDVAWKIPNLTPVAIRLGETLATSLFSPSSPSLPPASSSLNPDLIPTTIFTTPVEYACVGLTEEAAVAKFGKSPLTSIYCQTFTPLEHAAAAAAAVRQGSQSSPGPRSCLCKLICAREGSTERVVGVHFVGPNAGEVIQGFAVALAAVAAGGGGLTKAHLDQVVGVHPTNVEAFVGLTYERDSGLGPLPTVAGVSCGGGRCG